MRKTYLAGLSIIAIFALGVMAVPKTMAEKQTKENRSVKIEGATSENPVVSLGKAFDKKSGKEVEGYAIVHYAKGSGSASKPTTGGSCYGYIAKGAKWKGISEPWVVDSVNTGGLTPAFILQNMTGDITKWEIASGANNDILGNGSESVGSIIPNNALDYQNEVTFAPIDNAGAIAVTYVWGTFGGPTFNRQIVEWDQIYNDKYQWSQDALLEPTKMDFENIATHELGHAVGMADLYTSGCNQETMFGYADYGQINKRDLNAGDVTGIDLLY